MTSRTRDSALELEIPTDIMTKETERESSSLSTVPKKEATFWMRMRASLLSGPFLKKAETYHAQSLNLTLPISSKLSSPKQIFYREFAPEITLSLVIRLLSHIQGGDLHWLDGIHTMSWGWSETSASIKCLFTPPNVQESPEGALDLSPRDFIQKVLKYCALPSGIPYEWALNQLLEVMGFIVYHQQSSAPIIDRTLVLKTTQIIMNEGEGNMKKTLVEKGKELEAFLQTQQSKIVTALKLKRQSIADSTANLDVSFSQRDLEDLRKPLVESFYLVPNPLPAIPSFYEKPRSLIKSDDECYRLLPSHRQYFDFAVALTASQPPPNLFNALKQFRIDMQIGSFSKPLEPRLIEECQLAISYLTGPDIHETDMKQSSHWFRQTASTKQLESLTSMGVVVYVKECKDTNRHVDPVLLATYVKSMLRTIPGGLFPDPLAQWIQAILITKSGELSSGVTSHILHEETVMVLRRILSLHPDRLILTRLLGRVSRYILQNGTHDPILPYALARVLIVDVSKLLEAPAPHFVKNGSSGSLGMSYPAPSKPVPPKHGDTAYRARHDRQSSDAITSEGVKWREIQARSEMIKAELNKWHNALGVILAHSNVILEGSGVEYDSNVGIQLYTKLMGQKMA